MSTRDRVTRSSGIRGHLNSQAEAKSDVAATMTSAADGGHYFAPFAWLTLLVVSSVDAELE